MHKLLKMQLLHIISVTSTIIIVTPGSMASELNANLNERIRDFLLKTIFNKLRKYWQCKMHLLCILSYLKTKGFSFESRKSAQYHGREGC